jgi:putative transposase
VKENTTMAEGQRMTVADVVAKTMDGRLEDFVREAVALVARELMEAEISAEIGAELGEVAPEVRLTHRNGYRPRAWETRVGEIELLLPKKRQGSYFPSFLEPRRRSEQAIVAVVLEAYVNGVSTRKVDRLVEQLGIDGMTKDRVSVLCRALDEQVELFRQRPLEGAYPYLWLDAKQVKVRDHGRVVSKAVVVAYAVHESGVREVIGLDVGEVESGAFWTEILRSLRKRGLEGVRLAISDQHEGLKARSPACWAARGSAALSTSPGTWSSTAAATSAGSSPPRSGRSSTPRATSRPRSVLRTCSSGLPASHRRYASCSRPPKKT